MGWDSGSACKIAPQRFSRQQFPSAAASAAEMKMIKSVCSFSRFYILANSGILRETPTFGTFAAQTNQNAMFLGVFEGYVQGLAIWVGIWVILGCLSFSYSFLFASKGALYVTMSLDPHPHSRVSFSQRHSVTIIIVGAYPRTHMYVGTLTFRVPTQSQGSRIHRPILSGGFWSNQRRYLECIAT